MWLKICDGGVSKLHFGQAIARQLLNFGRFFLFVHVISNYFCLSGKQFFQKAGVADTMNVYDLFNAVSGLQIDADNEAEFLAQVRSTSERVCNVSTLLYVDIVGPSDI